MIFVDCYRRNVYIDDNLVGYIDGDGFIYISGKRFAELTEDGDIYIGDDLVGYIDDGGDIYLREKLVGNVTPSNDLKFNNKAL